MVALLAYMHETGEKQNERRVQFLLHSDYCMLLKAGGFRGFTGKSDTNLHHKYQSGSGSYQIENESSGGILPQLGGDHITSAWIKTDERMFQKQNPNTDDIIVLACYRFNSCLL